MYRGVAVSAPTLQSTLVCGIRLVNIHRRGGGAPCESRRGGSSETPKETNLGVAHVFFFILACVHMAVCGCTQAI